ncbi:MAG: TIR domain-containing protein [Burkholderiales bacterium]|nr:TIR domain-containing protein [Burkholderiales bacterium]
MALKIFISHAAADEPLASALVDFLLSSMVLDDDEIRCTSVPGHKLPVGCDFSETLLTDLEDTAVVVGLVTKSAVSSSWVLFELGATWGARKALRPLVTDEVDLKTLPGALSGKHVARLSKSSDVSQFLEELTSTIKAKPRSRAKIDKALSDLLLAHSSHLAASAPPKLRTKAQAEVKEPTIAGVPFSELASILRKEKIVIPAKHAGGKEDVEQSLLGLFLSNDKALADGLQSNYDKDSAAAFLYQEVGLRLLPFGLVQFEKLPAAQAKWFKRLGISADGNKFLLHFKRLSAKPKEGDAKS